MAAQRRARRPTFAVAVRAGFPRARGSAARAVRCVCSAAGVACLGRALARMRRSSERVCQREGGKQGTSVVDPKQQTINTRTNASQISGCLGTVHPPPRSSVLVRSISCHPVASTPCPYCYTSCHKTMWQVTTRCGVPHRLHRPQSPLPCARFPPLAPGSEQPACSSCSAQACWSGRRQEQRRRCACNRCCSCALGSAGCSCRHEWRERRAGSDNISRHTRSANCHLFDFAEDSWFERHPSTISGCGCGENQVE